MKIINIVPGFGGSFYCGNCLRDSAFTQTLKQSGHEAYTLPIYLPLEMNPELQNGEQPVFYGAVNVYLKQQFSWFRKMPAWMERFFNSEFILRYAAKKAGSTRADGLEEMSISMLKGADGYQQSELEELIHYLKEHEKPDLVHLSNALLIGMAKRIKEELNIPVVCSLQDEDVWVEAMRPHYKKKMWNLLAEKSEDIDAFIAVSDFFAHRMKNFMQIPAHKLYTIPIGINPDDYTYREPNISELRIGYLSRLNEENGFGLSIDAFIQLKKDPQFKTVKIRVGGGYTGDDLSYIRKQKRKLKRNGILQDVEFIEDYHPKQVSSFFNGLSLLSVPVLNGEAFGLYQLEAIASGIPMVQPNLGAFPEIALQTGASKIYKPNTAAALNTAWKELLLAPDHLLEMSKLGRQNVEAKYHIKKLTEEMIAVYENLHHKYVEATV